MKKYEKRAVIAKYNFWDRQSNQHCNFYSELASEPIQKKTFKKTTKILKSCQYGVSYK